MVLVFGGLGVLVIGGVGVLALGGVGVLALGGLGVLVIGGVGVLALGVLLTFNVCFRVYGLRAFFTVLFLKPGGGGQ